MCLAGVRAGVTRSAQIPGARRITGEVLAVGAGLVCFGIAWVQPKMQLHFDFRGWSWACPYFAMVGVIDRIHHCGLDKIRPLGREILVVPRNVYDRVHVTICYGTCAGSVYLR